MKTMMVGVDAYEEAKNLVKAVEELFKQGMDAVLLVENDRVACVCVRFEAELPPLR